MHSKMVAKMSIRVHSSFEKSICNLSKFRSVLVHDNIYIFSKTRHGLGTTFLVLKNCPVGCINGFVFSDFAYFQKKENLELSSKRSAKIQDSSCTFWSASRGECTLKYR